MLTAPISSTETGTYVVIWQALAADTHPSRGAFSFVVGKSSANPYRAAVSGGEIGTATPLGFVLQALARWIHFLGIALTFGIIAYQLLTRREPRLRRLLVAGVVLLIAAEPVALVAQLASLSFDGDTAIAVLASPFGRLLGLRLGAALLVWALLALESPWPVLGLGGVMALIDGTSCSTLSMLPRWASGWADSWPYSSRRTDDSGRTQSAPSRWRSAPVCSLRSPTSVHRRRSCRPPTGGFCS